jgi:hypothetical protein
MSDDKFVVQEYVQNGVTYRLIYENDGSFTIDKQNNIVHNKNLVMTIAKVNIFDNAPKKIDSHNCCFKLVETEDGYTYNLKECCQESRVDMERYTDFKTGKTNYKNGYYHELSCKG